MQIIIRLNLAEADMADRLQRLRQAIANNTNNIDALIVTEPRNMRYVSGFIGSTGMAVITPSESMLFVDGRYTTQAREQAGGFEVIECSEGFANELAKHGYGRVGFEAQYTSVRQHEKMREVVCGADFFDAGHIIEDMRLIKEPCEIEKITRAAEIADKAFSHIRGYIKEGVRECDVAIELEFYMKRSGAERLAFDVIVASGARSALPHGEPSDKKIQSGDLVLLDFGAVCEGYCSDISRTIVVGEPSRRVNVNPDVLYKQREIFDVVIAAQETALGMIKSGVRACDVDAAARDVIKQAGYGDYFSHSLGHGVGLNVHEKPRLSQKDETVLKAGMVVTVEPGVYIPDFGGVRIEDLVLVLEDGVRNFTGADKKIILDS